MAGANARRFHLKPPASWGAAAVMRLGSGLLGRRLERIYGYDAGTVEV